MSIWADSDLGRHEVPSICNIVRCGSKTQIGKPGGVEKPSQPQPTKLIMTIDFCITSTGRYI